MNSITFASHIGHWILVPCHEGACLFVFNQVRLELNCPVVDIIFKEAECQLFWKELLPRSHVTIRFLCIKSTGICSITGL